MQTKRMVIGVQIRSIDDYCLLLWSRNTYARNVNTWFSRKVITYSFSFILTTHFYCVAKKKKKNIFRWTLRGICNSFLSTCKKKIAFILNHKNVLKICWAVFEDFLFFAFRTLFSSTCVINMNIYLKDRHPF